jgi:zinc transporter 1/2/3
MDPAYSAIGPNTCVGMTGGWASYSWPPALILVSVMVIFLMDFAAERYVEIHYGVSPIGHNIGEALTDPGHASHVPQPKEQTNTDSNAGEFDELSLKAERSFRQQIAGFLILEFGVIFQ